MKLQISGRDVFIQERIPGVGLCVAWQYLDKVRKQSFKNQARHILQQLQSIEPNVGIKRPTYLVLDIDPVEHRGIQKLEQDILFNSANDNSKFALMHNDMSTSNLIVDNDRIVGLVDWEMAGFFSWEAAQAVHENIRSPKREGFRALKLSQDRLDDILFWNDLYATGLDQSYAS